MIKYVKRATEKCGQNAEGFQQFWKLKQIIQTKIRKEKNWNKVFRICGTLSKGLVGTSVLELNSFQKTVRKQVLFPIRKKKKVNLINPFQILK